MRIYDVSAKGQNSLALCTDQLAIHRLQLAIVLAIAEVFAVYGTEFIFSSSGALKAVGVGWLLLAIVDVSVRAFCECLPDIVWSQLVWILYLTSEEDSLFYHLLNSAGNGGLSGYSRRGARRDSTPAFAGGETGMIGGISGNGFSATPRNNGYSVGGYAPTATETTPQKATAIRDGYGNHLPAESEEQYKHRAR